MIRFGKPSGPLISQKTAFFTDNDRLQENIRRICSIYASQPARTHCKNCGQNLEGSSFTKLGVTYIQCSACTHLNGANEDTDQFCQAVYTDNGGASYAVTYSAADREAYQSRVDAIYKPKADFLFEAIGNGARDLAYADMGAGSGYFVAALVSGGAKRVKGYEVGAAQVELAKQMTGAEMVLHGLDEIEHIAATAKADVISFIGVLEHLREPRKVLKLVSGNPAIKYVYFSVPMFSPTVYLESIFPDVFHRHLGAGHTHLYTDRSIDWFCNEFGFKRHAEWWFGTDFVDLYRDVLIKLAKNSDSKGLADSWQQMFSSIIDPLQMQIDSRKLSSEVHMVLTK